MSKIKQYIDELVILSRDNLKFDKRYRLAAAIVYKNKIVSYGFNSRKSNPLQMKFGKTEHSVYLHAEIDAIKNALKKISPQQLSKSTLLVARSRCINGDVVHGLAKPCAGCQRAIVAFGIPNVFYTEDNTGYSKL